MKTWLNSNDYDTSNGLTPDAETAALAQFVPMQPVAVSVEPETIGGQVTQIQSRTNPLIPINIENLTINVTTANTAQLNDETAHFQQVNAAALQGIGRYLQADLVATVQSQVAQNRHAVAGLGASAAVNLANSLGKPQADTAA
ncbi:MAG: hypothetical protein HC812_13740 [Leptolyngbya sp. RL_3_1]|nr:hypothetical protein [Leptolyngbya sp. RL_3_1]